MSLTRELDGAMRRSKPVSTGARDRALRRARRCYEHLAGELAVQVAASMASKASWSSGLTAASRTRD